MSGRDSAAWREWHEHGRFNVTYFDGGTFLKVGASAAMGPIHSEPPPRGEVFGISRASRARMLRTFARLRTDAVSAALFVTLTYPDGWPSLAECKRHLAAWWKRCRRSFPFASAIWRMEPQTGFRGGEGRGAPHFHLVVFGVSFIDRDWLSRTWYEVVGSDDERHLRAGTSVEKVKAGRSVLGYIAKEMTAEKAGEFRDGATGEPVTHTGRLWGKLSGCDLPFGAERRLVFRGEAAREAVLEAVVRATEWQPARGWSPFMSLGVVTDNAGSVFEDMAAGA